MNKLIAFIGWLIINLISKTLRIKEVNAQELWKSKKDDAIFSFWHGEQFIPCYHHREQGVVIMSSLSKDGEIQAGIMSKFGYEVVRGSSSRGAEKALVSMIRLVKKGHSAAFAVDGPRGPLHKVKSGVVFLAQKTERFLIPVSASSKRFKIFSKAWDKYELPSPFTSSVIAYGEPIEVYKGDPVEAASEMLENSMIKLSRFTHEGYYSKDIMKYLEDHPRPKILIIQPSRIGDVVFSLPTLSALRKRYPNAWIGWIVDERCAPLIENNKYLDEVIVFDRSKLSPGYLLKFTRKLRGLNIDISIDLHGLSKSAFLALLAGAKHKIASVSTNGMRELSWLVSKPVPIEKEELHCVHRHLSVAKYLGCDIDHPEYFIEIDEKNSSSVEKVLASKGVNGTKPLVVIHPGGGWISRRWFPERFAFLIDKLTTELNCQVVLVGGKEGGSAEKGLDEEIISLTKVKPVNLTGILDLKQLAALLSRSKLVVANEAGPMHIASALGIPAIAILGPTNAGRTGPYSSTTRIIQHKIECQPCRERNCASKECMKLVTVDEVFSAAKELL